MIAGRTFPTDTAAPVQTPRQFTLVLTVGTLTSNGMLFHGLGREPLGDPDDWAAYGPGLFWAEEFYSDGQPRNHLLAPMDARTIASPTGDGDYAFGRSGGLSWVVPYIAGVYALAAQVDPTITPDRFWSLARATGRSIQLNHQDQAYTLGTIIDLVGLIAALR